MLAPDHTTSLASADAGGNINAHYICSTNILSSETAFINTTVNGITHQMSFQALAGGAAATLDEAHAYHCTGPIRQNAGTMFAIGIPALGSPSTSSFGIYEFTLSDVAFGTGNINRRKAGTIAPATVDATWTHFTDISGPCYDQADGNIMVMVATTDSVTHQCYLIKYRPSDATVVWQLALPFNSSNPVGAVTFSQAKIQNERYAFLQGHTVYIIDTIAGTYTTHVTNSGLDLSSGQQWDDASSSVTFFGDYSTSGSGATMTYIGNYLPAHSDAYSDKWGRLYIGLLHTYAPPTYTNYSTPTSFGFTYTSRGQLLRPDSGQDAGARNGPAFGKKRRIAQAALGLYRTQQMTWGTSFDKMYPVKMLTPGGGSPIVPPTFYSGITWDSINDDYGFESQICWQQTRPYPGMIQAISGFIETQDK